MQAEQLLDPLKEQFNVPTSLIQEHDLLVIPVLLWQGGHHQHPPGVIQRARLQLALIFARFAFGFALRFLLLLLAQTHDHQTQLDPQLGNRDPHLPAPDRSRLRVQAFQPGDQINGLSPLGFHREARGADTYDDLGQFGAYKRDAGAQPIGSIRHHEIPGLQIKDLQLLSLVRVGDFDLGEPTSQQIERGVHTQDHPRSPDAFPVGSIDQKNAPEPASHQPGRQACRHRQQFLQEPLQPGTGLLQVLAPGGV